MIEIKIFFIQVKIYFLANTIKYFRGFLASFRGQYTVILYMTLNRTIEYLYDTSHGEL